MKGFTILSKKDMNDVPKTTGVYLFYENSNILYIGKAINLRDRVKNHFQQPSYRDNLFIHKVARIGFCETGSEIESLLLEAVLIKKHQPRFNVLWRDDKNYFYVAIAQNQGLPYLFITHQKNEQDTDYIGPFVEGNSLKKSLRFLRRVFPYYTVKKHSKSKCTWCHLDLCPGPNPDIREYQKSIKKLTLILKGKRKTVLNALAREMKEYSKKGEFEYAAKVRDQMYALQHVMLHTHVIEPARLEQNSWVTTEKTLQGLLDVLGSISRIECYDISNIQGKQATGSMVVFVDGVPDKSQYRKFRIKSMETPNDIAMLKEVFFRRFANTQWEYPDVMLIDGGIAQLNAAIEVKMHHKNAKSIRIISIAKRLKELFIEGRPTPVRLKVLPQEIYNLIIHLDDEAHRFAVSYHKKLRKKNLLQ